MQKILIIFFTIIVATSLLMGYETFSELLNKYSDDSTFFNGYSVVGFIEDNVYMFIVPTDQYIFSYICLGNNNYPKKEEYDKYLKYFNVITNTCNSYNLYILSCAYIDETINFFTSPNKMNLKYLMNDPRHFYSYDDEIVLSMANSNLLIGIPKKENDNKNFANFLSNGYTYKNFKFNFNCSFWDDLQLNSNMLRVFIGYTEDI